MPDDPDRIDPGDDADDDPEFEFGATEAADGPVLSPDELDITDDDNVAELDDGRYVVSANDGEPDVGDRAPDPTRERRVEGDAGRQDADGLASGVEGPARGPNAGGRGDASNDVDGGDVSRWLAESFADNGFSHGFDATMKVDGTVNRHRMVSNDVGATFETLVLWYARQVAGDTPPEEALGLLLANSDIPVEYPLATLQEYLESHDLALDDSIAELLSAARDDDGFVVE